MQWSYNHKAITKETKKSVQQQIIISWPFIMSSYAFYGLPCLFMSSCGGNIKLNNTTKDNENYSITHLSLYKDRIVNEHTVGHLQTDEENKSKFLLLDLIIAKIWPIISCHKIHPSQKLQKNSSPRRHSKYHQELRHQIGMDYAENHNATAKSRVNVMRQLSSLLGNSSLVLTQYDLGLYSSQLATWHLNLPSHNCRNNVWPTSDQPITELHY